jgi:hypothetical protein
MILGKGGAVLKIVALAGLCCVFLFAGCAGIQPPTPDEVMSHPLGTESIKIGMTKEQVESLWGKPDEIRQVEDKTRWKGSREEWVYRPKYGALVPVPVDAGYLSRTKRLHFDGNNLTDIGE